MTSRMAVILSLILNPLVIQPAFAKKVKLEWKPIEGAIGYEIQIQSTGKPTIQESTESPNWRGDLAEGTYFYQIRAIDEVKRPGTWSEVSPLAVLPPAPQPKYPAHRSKLEFYSSSVPVRLKWEPVTGAKEYILELFNSDFSNDEPVLKTQVTGTEYELKGLRPGKYSWKLSAILKPSGRVPASFQNKSWETPAGESATFNVEHKKLESPRPVFPVQMEPPPDRGEVRFKWKEINGAEAYEVQVIRIPANDHRRSAQELAPALVRSKKHRTHDNSITLRLPGEGSYLWGVRGLANFNEAKKPLAFGPETVTQFSLDRNAIFRGDLGYLAASIMLAPYKYQIKSPTYKVQGDTQASALVARLSGEYIVHPKWALSAGFDYTTFQILQSTFNRVSAELLIKYRMKLTSGQDGWFFSPKIGPEVREYNQVIPSNPALLNTGASSNSILTLGVTAGFDLRKQFSDRFSLGAKAGYYIPTTLLTGVTDGSQVAGGAAKRNFHFGLQGLYWLSKSLGFGAGGYFDMRSLSFTTPSSSVSEEVFMDGAYFYGSVVYRI